MKAVLLRELGEPENLRLEEVPHPKPGPHEVVVRLKAAALNHRDVWIRRGRYAGIRLPIILGSDGAGEVVQAGSAVDLSLTCKEVVIYPAMNWGDDEKAPAPDFKILGLPDDGTYAQLVKVPATHIFPKPPGLTFEEAAAIPLAALTAFRALVTRAQVRAGETVVITGIGGGVAIFALQIALRLGALVFVTSGSDAKLARALEMGAAGGANYRTQDWVQQIQTLCKGEGPHVIIDSAGGDSFGKAVEVIRPGGRLVTYGATAGPVQQLEIRRIFWKQLNVLGSTMGTVREFGEMLKLYGDGGLRPVVDKVFPLTEAAAAHHRMEDAKQFGKIVLRIT
jgi:zinc-binding alcohol dehydrogenase/oxidoreductase